MILKRLWKDKISLILLILSIFIIIGFFTKELNVPFEVFFVLYIIYQVNEKGVFFDKVREDYPNAATELGIAENYRRRKSVMFIIGDIVILLGTVLILTLVAIKFIW